MSFSSNGVGKKEIIESMNSDAVASISVEPKNTGLIEPVLIPFFRPDNNSSSVRTSPSRYLVANSSSVSATNSISSSRINSASS